MSSKQVYIVRVPYSGYVSGEKEFSVCADSEEEALEKAREGCFEDLIDTHVDRDDTDSCWEDAHI